MTRGATIADLEFRLALANCRAWNHVNPGDRMDAREEARKLEARLARARRRAAAVKAPDANALA